MHNSAMKNGKRFFDAYLSGNAAPLIVEIGSQDVNGSLRDVSPANCKYVGVDFVVGRGVDVVLDDPYRLPFPDDYADAVVSSSCFEHSEMFWILFQECIRILKPSGLLYINVPSNGIVHNYPVDCWRFYPDAGMALARWGRHLGYDVAVLESFTSEQDGDQWSDFISVFSKNPTLSRTYNKRISDEYKDFTNGRVNEGDIINPSALTQDLRTIEHYHQLISPEKVNIFAEPRVGIKINECHFYHTMEIPGHTVVNGAWDLREGVSDYLGRLDLSGKSVLEIGPASGFLTFEMEQRGADVLSVEVRDNPGWDFVPYPAYVLEPLLEPRHIIMQRLKNSWWFCHEAFGSRARLIYSNVYALPDEIGKRDIAVIGSVLLHTKAPLQIVEQCAKHADTIVITDMFFPDLEGSPVCRLIPNAGNGRWDTWWEFSTSFLIQFLGIMGFDSTVTFHSQPHRGHQYNFFTIVARREVTPSVPASKHQVA